MGTVLFKREIINAIMNLHKIADELEEMNKLKKIELYCEYGRTHVNYVKENL